MLEQDITKLTEKSRIKLAHRYSKKFIRYVRKEIRKAARAGQTVTSVHHTLDISWMEYEIKKMIRQSVIDYLMSNGFYVRKYEGGFLYQIDDYRISWGGSREDQQAIDELQSQRGEE